MRSLLDRSKNRYSPPFDVSPQLSTTDQRRAPLPPSRRNTSQIDQLDVHYTKLDHTIWRSESKREHLKDSGFDAG